jgi:hypothetical protein
MDPPSLPDHRPPDRKVGENVRTPIPSLHFLNSLPWSTSSGSPAEPLVCEEDRLDIFLSKLLPTGGALPVSVLEVLADAFLAEQMETLRDGNLLEAILAH